MTAGTPDANGNPAQFAGAVRLQPVFGNPSTPQDESDMTFYAKLDDVRCRPASTACASGALSDYTGELALELRLRLTDRLVKNLPSTSEGTIDVPISCAPTADPAIGSTCSVSTTADTLIPGSAPEGTKAIWELGQLRVWDAGADGSLAVDEGDSAVFATQGIFVP